MSLSEYTNYHRVHKQHNPKVNIDSPRLVKEDIIHAKFREDGCGAKIQMSHLRDIWIRINGVLTYIPVRVVRDKDISRQLLIMNVKPKLEKIVVHTPSGEEVVVPISPTAYIHTTLTGPKSSFRCATLVDTGAGTNCMSKDVFLALGHTSADLHDTEQLRTADNSYMRTLGLSDPIPLDIAGQIFPTTFTVVENLLSPVILGTTFTEDNGAQLKLRERTLELRPPGTIVTRSETYDDSTPAHFAHIQTEQTLAAADGKLMKLTLDINEHQKRQLEGRQVIVLPVDKIPTKKRRSMIDRSIAAGRVITTIRAGEITAPIFNAHELEKLRFPAGQCVAQIFPIRTEYQVTSIPSPTELGEYKTHNLINNINLTQSAQPQPELEQVETRSEGCNSDGLSSRTDFPAVTKGDKPFPTRPLVNHIKGDCTQDQWKKLQEIMGKHVKNDLFAKNKTEVGHSTIVKHTIELTPGAVPTRCGLRKMALDKATEANRQLRDLIDMGLVEPARSPFASAIVMAKKKGNELRLCIDFRALNDMTIKDAYPLPRIDLTMQKLGAARYFSSLDMGSAFWQIELDEKDRNKTAFVTEMGQFRWTRMPFGLCNATATFQRMMAKILEPVEMRYGSLVLCYVDDIIIATDTLEDHIKRLDEVFSLLHQAGLKLKAGKCDLLKKKIIFLGRIIEMGSVSMLPEHTETVTNWKKPINVKQMQCFLGFMNYYRQFVKDFASIIHPLQQLIRKETKYVWTEECQQAFEKLKESLTRKGPILTLPTNTDMFVLDCDASDVAISGILHQRRPEVGQGKLIDYPVAYGSRSLKDSEKNYGAPKAEMLAVVYFTNHYSQYLLGKKFLLRVDNRALSWLKTYSTSTTTVARWIARLENFHFDIEHVRREKNQHADALTKKPEYLERKEADMEKPQMDGFGFMNQNDFDKLEVRKDLDQKGKPMKTDRITGKVVQSVHEVLQEMLIEPEEIDIPPERSLEEDLANSESMSELGQGDSGSGVPDQPERELSQTEPVTVQTIISLSENQPEQLPWWPIISIEESTAQVLNNDNMKTSPGCTIFYISDKKDVKAKPEETLTKNLWEFVTPQRYTFKQLREAQLRDNFISPIIDTLRCPDNRRSNLASMRPHVSKYFQKHEKEFILNKQGILLRTERMPDVGSNEKGGELTSVRRNWIILPSMFYFNVLFESHDRIGHPGQGKTIANIMQRFEWPGMDRDIRDYVSTCEVCQTSKHRQGKHKRLLKSIISNAPNDLIQMDHLKLPKNKHGYVAILVMIDHFSKYVEAAPCKEMTAEETARLLNDYWFCRHGPPKAIQSDNGSQFTSKLIKEFIKMNAVVHNLSTPYHPQTNGLVERQNRTMLALLKGFCLEQQQDWPIHLQKAVFSYNSLVHSTTGVTPHLLFTGSQKAIPLGNLFPEYAPEHQVSP